MPEKTIEIALPLLLPDLQDERDQCLDLLQTRMQARKGILKTHLELTHRPVDLCIHYDPNLVTLASVERMAGEIGATLHNGYQHEQIPFSGLDSADAALVLSHELERLPGMLHANVNYAAGLALVAYDVHTLQRAQIDELMRRFGAVPLQTCLDALDSTGPSAADCYPSAEEGHQHGGAPTFLPHWIQERWELLLLAACGLFLLAGWLGETFLALPAGAALVLYLLAYLAGGCETARHAIPSVLRGKFDTDVLMLAAAAGAAVLGEWAEGAFLLFLFGLGHTGEHYALDRARHAINALGELMPQTALVLRAGQPVETPVEQITPGELVLVRPGDRVPVDGVVEHGASSVDQSPITGESAPVAKRPADEVFAGTINQEAALEVRVTRLARDTTLSRVIKMVAEAQGQQSPTQQLTDKFTTRFVPAVLILVLLVIIVPPLAGWMPLPSSFYRAMLLLVAASPCALAIGTPAAVLAGIAQAARNGVLIKGGVHLENLGRLQVMAFDKTGTLTQGRFQLTDVIPLNGVKADEILRLAGAVEQHSNHPLAQAIVNAAQERQLPLPATIGLENVPGRGVRGEVEGQPVWIGSLKLLEEAEICTAGPTRETVAALEQSGRTTMLVGRGGEAVGVLALADAPRPGVREVLAKLQKLGIQKLVMLTGDNSQAAQRVAQQVGVTEVQAGLLPEHKLATIQQLGRQYGAVAMTGDGVNDAPALAAATVGIAMGGAGTAVALETADVALMADDLEKLPFAVGLSRFSRSIIQQNFAIALGVIILLVLTSVLGWVQLSWAVVFHEGSTVLVVLNALRLLRYQ